MNRILVKGAAAVLPFVFCLEDRRDDRKAETDLGFAGRGNSVWQAVKKRSPNGDKNPADILTFFT